MEASNATVRTGQELNSQGFRQAGAGSALSRSPWLEPAIVGIVVFLLYAFTGARDVLWGDPAKLMLFVYEGDITFRQEGHVGLVLYTWAFSILPIESYALRMHLSSAISMSVAIGIVHAILLGLGFSRSAARIGTAALAVAHTVWFTAAMFESYPLVLLLLSTSAWFLLVAEKNVMPGILVGLGVVVHPISLFGLLGVVYGLWKSDRGLRGVTRFLTGVGVGGLLPLLVVFILVPHQANVEEVNWASATGYYASIGYPVKNLPLLIAYLVYNFAGPALLLLGLGFAKISVTERIILLLFALPHLVVAVFWLPQRSYLIPLPVYFVMAYLIAAGAETVVRARRDLAVPLLILATILPVVIYAITPSIVVGLGLDKFVRDAPYREESTYFFQPWKVSDTSAREYLDTLARFLPLGSVVVGDWTLITTVNYAHRVERWREDLILVSAVSGWQRSCGVVGEHLDSGRRVFILDNEPGYLPDCMTE